MHISARAHTNILYGLILIKKRACIKLNSINTQDHRLNESLWKVKLPHLLKFKIRLNKI